MRHWCKAVSSVSQRPERSPLVAVHGHHRLVGLRYAPLVREVHREQALERAYTAWADGRTEIPMEEFRQVMKKVQIKWLKAPYIFHS